MPASESEVSWWPSGERELDSETDVTVVPRSAVNYAFDPYLVTTATRKNRPRGAECTNSVMAWAAPRPYNENGPLAGTRRRSNGFRPSCFNGVNPRHTWVCRPSPRGRATIREPELLRRLCRRHRAPAHMSPRAPVGGRVAAFACSRAVSETMRGVRRYSRCTDASGAIDGTHCSRHAACVCSARKASIILLAARVMRLPRAEISLVAMSAAVGPGPGSGGAAALRSARACGCRNNRRRSAPWSRQAARRRAST